jgi:hypothetical protein
MRAEDLDTFPIRAPRRECNGLTLGQGSAHSLCDQHLLTPASLNLGRRAVIAIALLHHLHFDLCIPPLPPFITIIDILPHSNYTHTHTHIHPSTTPTVLRNHTYTHHQLNSSLIPPPPLPARLFDDRRVVNQTCSRALFEVSWYVSSQCARECAANPNFITRQPTNILSSPLFNLKGHPIT